MTRNPTFETDMTTNSLNLPENMDDQIELFKKYNLNQFNNATSVHNPILKK